VERRYWRTRSPNSSWGWLDGDEIRYRTGTQGSGWSSWNKIWHSGNDGTGSGLDADLLDGKHWSDIKSYIDSNSVGSGNLLRVRKYESPGTYTWTKGAGTKYIKVFVWGAGGGIYNSGGSIYYPSGGNSSFGNYVYAFGGSSHSGGGFSGVGVIGVRGESTPVGYSRDTSLSVAPVQLVQYEGSNYGYGGRMYYNYSRAVGAGGFATKVIDVTAINSVPVVVGSS